MYDHEGRSHDRSVLINQVLRSGFLKRLRIFLANVGVRTPLYQLATPPMGLLYLASYLREKFAVDIQIINQRLEGLSCQKLAVQAAVFNADIVGLSCMTPFAHALPNLVEEIRQCGSKALIVIGGAHVSAFGSDSLQASKADMAVAGEGERSMEMIVERYLEGRQFNDIPGLIWRSEAGETMKNPGTALVIDDLDTIPMPAYDLIDITKYWHVQSMPPIVRRRYISLLSSRGCPYGCMWCHNIFGRRYRSHSPERIVEEIAYYKKKYHVNDVEFIDDIFNLDRKRVLEFSDILIARNGPIRIAFPNAIRADILDEQTVDALAKSGTYFCSFALESGSPRIQELSQKRLDIEKFAKSVELAANKKIFTNGFMMLGFPHETEEEMQETISIAADSKLHTASFYTVTPFPGTPLYDYVMANIPDKVAHINYSNSNFCQMKVNLSSVSDATLYYYQRKAMRDFFFRPSRLYRILRDYPQPYLLPTYLPIFVNRAIKGILT